MSSIIIDLSGRLSGTCEEPGVSIENDMRLQELNSILALLNGDADTNPITAKKLDSLFNRNLARFARALKSGVPNEKLPALQIDIDHVPSKEGNGTTIRTRFSIINAESRT